MRNLHEWFCLHVSRGSARIFYELVSNVSRMWYEDGFDQRWLNLTQIYGIENWKLKIMHYALWIMNCLWAFRLSPSGFPLYLFPLRSKRMPLQSLTLRGCHKTNASLGLGTDLIRRRDIVIYNHPISILIWSCTFSNLSIIIYVKNC